MSSVTQQIVAKAWNFAHVLNFKRASRLRQSILKRAFEGKLVPQDPNDEPAIQLLERIRAEREKLDNGSPSKRKNTRKRRAKTPAKRKA